MHAYLIVGDKEKVASQIKKLTEESVEDSFSFNLAKIDDVRDLTKFLMLKRDEKSGIVIEDIQKATDEALNAFLKLLEEPPQNIYFFLTTDKASSVMSTIRSRCTLITAGSDNTSDEETFKTFYKKNLTEKFATVLPIKEREDAIEFVTILLYSAHAALTKNQNEKISKFLEIANKTLNSLNANGNVFLHLNLMVIESENLKREEGLNFK